MPNFIARVELHSASYADYENLHVYMQQRAFSRTIKGDNGSTYQLPTGTYVNVGTYSSHDASLQAGGSNCKRNRKILVHHCGRLEWCKMLRPSRVNLDGQS